MKRTIPHISLVAFLRQWTWGVVAMALFLPVFVSSCMHEPFAVVDPDPVDPIDTMDVDTPTNPCQTDIVYFERDILPILRSNCAKSGCHDAITQEDGVILDTYEHVMATGDVRPFEADKSDLYEVLTESDPDKRMPPPPNQRLTQAQVDLIEKWIDQGAQNLTCDDNAGECNTTGVSYAGFVAPVLQTYCVGCHSGGLPSGNILLNSHANVRTVALNGRLMGAITWAAGYQPMPRGSGQLSDCTIDKINAWINEGAPDN